MIRVLLADDNPAMRSALALLLETRLHAQVVGEVHSMDDLLSMVRLKRPDIVILDWELPGLPKNGRIAALREACPHLKIVITSSQPEVSQQALAAHADAFVSRVEPPEQMVRALHAI